VTGKVYPKRGGVTTARRERARCLIFGDYAQLLRYRAGTRYWGPMRDRRTKLARSVRVDRYFLARLLLALV
jgi:hypothetical protein